MIDEYRSDSYLTSELTQVTDNETHQMMSQYVLDIQDQSPTRGGNVNLNFGGSTTNYVDLKNHQNGRSYPLKRSDSINMDANNASNPITPSSFLNPPKITEDQEQFAAQLTKSIDKIAHEREGAARQRSTHSPSTNSPGSGGGGGYARASTNPPTPVSNNLCLKLSDDMDLNRMSGMQGDYVFPVVSNGNHQVLQISPPSTNGESASPISPSLDSTAAVTTTTGTSGIGVATRFPIVSVATRHPSYSLPPLRTLEEQNNLKPSPEPIYANHHHQHHMHHSPRLTEMLVATDNHHQQLLMAQQQHQPVVDLSAQPVMAPISTTDGFMHLFPNPPDQLDPNGGHRLGGHLTNLVSSYDGHLHQQQQGYLQAYSQAPEVSSAAHQHMTSTTTVAQKRNLSMTNSGANSGGAKRSRRRHAPTIAAAQALINATPNGMGQLTYNQADIMGLKMEDASAQSPSGCPIQQHQQQQQEMQAAAGSSGMNIQEISYSATNGGDVTNESSLNGLEEDINQETRDQRIEKKRARNRLAARRCRERKVAKINDLEKQVAGLNVYVGQLREQLNVAQKEAEDLRHFLSEVSESVPGVGERLKLLLAQQQLQQQSALAMHHQQQQQQTPQGLNQAPES